VECSDRREDLPDEGDAPLPRDLPVEDQAVERLPLEERHHQEAEGLAVGCALLTKVEDRREVGVVEGPSDAGLQADLSALLLAASVFGVDHLHGDPSAHVRVDRRVDAGRASLSDRNLEPKAAAEDSLA